MRRSTKRWAWQYVASEIQQHHPALQWFPLILPLLINLSLTYIAAASVPCIFQHGGKAIALALANNSCYDLAERVYSVVRSQEQRTGGTCLASTRNYGVGEIYTLGMVLRESVREVYGSTSRELVETDLNLGCNSLWADEFRQAGLRFQQAADLSRSLNMVGSSVEALSRLAEVQIQRDDSVAAHITLRKAINAIPNDDSDIDISFGTMEQLLRVANMLDAHKEARLISERSIAIQNKKDAACEADRRASLACSLVLLCLLLSSKLFLKTLLADISKRRIRQLSEIADAQFSILLLHRLVAIELFRGNIQRADEFSRRMLNLAEKITN